MSKGRNRQPSLTKKAELIYTPSPNGQGAGQVTYGGFITIEIPNRGGEEALKIGISTRQALLIAAIQGHPLTTKEVQELKEGLQALRIPPNTKQKVIQKLLPSKTEEKKAPEQSSPPKVFTRAAIPTVSPAPEPKAAKNPLPNVDVKPPMEAAAAFAPQKEKTRYNKNGWLYIVVGPVLNSELFGTIPSNYEHKGILIKLVTGRSLNNNERATCANAIIPFLIKRLLREQPIDTLKHHLGIFPKDLVDTYLKKDYRPPRRYSPSVVETTGKVIVAPPKGDVYEP